MYNILVLSKDSSKLRDLTDLLKRDFFTLYEHPYEAKDTYQSILHEIDFVIMELSESFHENIIRIQDIKHQLKAPLYVFSNETNKDNIQRYLEQGSEGHIDIPFDAELTAARIKAVLRFLHNVHQPNHSIQKLGRLLFHQDNHEIIMGERRILLTDVEFKIVKILIENRDVAVSKDRIIHAVWDNDDSATDNALGIHITRLRKKLKCIDGTDLIETVWGLGYRINIKQCES